MPEGVEVNYEHLSQDSRFQSRDMSPGLPECGKGCLITQSPQVML
jgi:hypothetical protein